MLKRTYPERPNHNPSEGVIREIQGKWFRTVIRNRVSIKSWDYGVRWTTQVMQNTSTQSGGLRAICSLQDVTGEKPDISESLYFGFYDHVSYKDNSGFGMTDIGRWIGVSQIIGGLVYYWILTHKGTVI